MRIQADAELGQDAGLGRAQPVEDRFQPRHGVGRAAQLGDAALAEHQPHRLRQQPDLRAGHAAVDPDQAIGRIFRGGHVDLGVRGRRQRAGPGARARTAIRLAARNRKAQFRAPGAANGHRVAAVQSRGRRPPPAAAGRQNRPAGSRPPATRDCSRAGSRTACRDRSPPAAPGCGPSTRGSDRRPRRPPRTAPRPARAARSPCIAAPGRFRDAPAVGHFGGHLRHVLAHSLRRRLGHHVGALAALQPGTVLHQCPCARRYPDSRSLVWLIRRERSFLASGCCLGIGHVGDEHFRRRPPCRREPGSAGCAAG